MGDEEKIIEENKEMEKRLKKIMDRKKSKNRGPDRYVVFAAAPKYAIKLLQGLFCKKNSEGGYQIFIQI